VNPDNGIISKSTTRTVDETVERIKTLLQSKGIKLFAVIDHSGEAEAIGIKMAPTKLLIFGNPKGGTPLMLASPTVAIDLPLKLLVWQDARGDRWISYNSPHYLKDRHSLPDDLLKNTAVIEPLATESAK
jgi:uncharacterized protein (DUF302 family)